LLGGGLLLVGLVALMASQARRGPSQHAHFLLLYLLIPSALLLAVAYDRPKFNPRYLLVMTPAFYLILSWGIALLLSTAIFRRTWIALRVGLAILAVVGLSGTI